MDWHYERAKDFGLGLLDRLATCPREPDPLIDAARLGLALAIRVGLKLYNRFEIRGREHLPSDRGFVLVANHASHLDAIALLCALPLRSLPHAYPLAARDYFSANRLRLVLSAIIANLMLIDRDAKALEQLKGCQEMLREGEHVLMLFPEGTRSQDGQVARFRRGIGSLLAGTAIPVVPCFLDGTLKALPKGRWTIRPAPIRLTIGTPRTYEQIQPTDAGVLHICAELREAVLALAPETCPQRAQPNSQEVFS